MCATHYCVCFFKQDIFDLERNVLRTPTPADDSRYRLQEDVRNAEAALIPPPSLQHFKSQAHRAGGMNC